LLRESIEVGMVPPPERWAEEQKEWTGEKVQFWYATLARAIARMMIEAGRVDPGTYEYRVGDDDGTDVLLCTLEIDDERRVFVTYPNNLTIGFEGQDLSEPEDN
jgi:hypothetical protein